MYLLHLYIHQLLMFDILSAILVPDNPLLCFPIISVLFSPNFTEMIFTNTEQY